ncbi:MAG: ABC transporter permease subunit [Alphaproteobacteria bacterium]|nr:ABC transporter permease subunit [Alphaproteobacteria bacterium]
MVSAIWLSLKLAGVTTPIVLVLAALIAWFGSPLAQASPHPSAGTGGVVYRRLSQILRQIVMVLVTVPIILPPTVLGFYLLLFLGANGPIVWLGQSLGLVHPNWRGLAFSFPGLVIGSVVFCLPFAVQNLQTAFAQLNKRLFDVAACLGAGPWRRFYRLALPLCRQSIVAAALLSFAHTIGEFGVVLMLGGNIPGATQLLSIALYDAVEAGQFQQAHLVAGGLLLFAMAIMLAVTWLMRDHRQPSLRR